MLVHEEFSWTMVHQESSSFVNRITLSLDVKVYIVNSDVTYIYLSFIHLVARAFFNFGYDQVLVFFLRKSL